MFNRRSFLHSLTAMTSALSLPQKANAQDSDILGDLLPQRRLGKTDEYVTMLGLGGAHVDSQFNESGAQEIIETSLAGGVRFFDTAHSYGGGRSEERYGRFLTPKYREHVFIMSKAELNTAAKVRQQLEDTLRRLNTDYLDLWQMHQVMSADDADDRIAHGVLEEFVKAKDEGKVRYIGFTGHRDPAAHLRVLGETDIFQTCQMPINCADPSYGSFIRSVLPELVPRDFGVIAMKTLACGGFFGGTTWFQNGPKPKICPTRMSVQEAIHFVWSMPVSVLVTGPNSVEQMQEKIDLARSYTGMSEDERQQLIDKVVDLTPDSGVEFYKADGLQTSADWQNHCD
ncbi:MAG: aldo/keto reductase [Candidatus Hinthialibacter antarcticus]|nr:aldo/keto reductase [Candidatus Hinthialibacter antarcticus]